MRELKISDPQNNHYMFPLYVSTSFTLWHNIMDKNNTTDKLEEAISLVKPPTDLTNEKLAPITDRLAGHQHAELLISIQNLLP